MTTLIPLIAVSLVRQRFIDDMDRWLAQDRGPAAANAPTLEFANKALLLSPKLNQIFLSSAVI